MEKDPLVCIIGNNRFSIDRFVTSNRLKREDYIIISSVQSLRGFGEVMYLFLDGWDESSLYPVNEIAKEIVRMNRGRVLEFPDDIVIGENYFEIIKKYEPIPIFKGFMNLMLKRYFQQ